MVGAHREYSVARGSPSEDRRTRSPRPNSHDHTRAGALKKLILTSSDGSPNVDMIEKIPFPREDDDGSTVPVEVKSNGERFCETILTILSTLIEALDSERTLLRCPPRPIKVNQGLVYSASSLATIDLGGCRVLRSSLHSSALMGCCVRSMVSTAKRAYPRGTEMTAEPL